MKFGNSSGGAGKRYVSSTSLPAKAKGAIKHVPQKVSKFPGKTGMTKKDGGVAYGKSADVTNPVPGRFDNDVLTSKQKAKAYKGMPVAAGQTGTRKVSSGATSSTKGFVESRGREFKSYK